MELTPVLIVTVMVPPSERPTPLMLVWMERRAPGATGTTVVAVGDPAPPVQVLMVVLVPPQVVVHVTVHVFRVADGVPTMTPDWERVTV